jgi:uncharacterized repeat protein (TIGR01451 family)
VTKTVTPAQAQVGQTVTYSMTVTNHGPNPATGVVATDQLPSGVVYGASTPSQGAYDQVSGRWTIGALAVGQSVSLSITATVEVPGAITNVITRTTQNEPDGDPANDSAAVVINGSPYADIAVRKTAAPSTPAVGAPVTFTVVVTNRGPFDAPAVTVDDAVPAGVTFVSAVATTGTYAVGTGRWTVGALPVGASATLTMVATVSQAGPIVNRAVVSGVGVTDPNPANDQDSVVVNAGLGTNLRIAKVALAPIVGVFEYADFLVTVTNDGPGPATAIVVADTLPAGLSFTSAQTSQGLYTPSTGLWTVGNLGPTDSATLRLTALVTTAGTVLNTATIIGSGEPDPDPNDNSSTAPVVTPLPGGGQCSDVELTQRFSPSVAPGGQVQFVFTATNRGPAYAQDVMISGAVPAGTAVETLTPSAGGTCAVVAGEVHCTWPGPTLIGPGSARTVDVRLRVAPSTPPGTLIWGWFMSMTSNADCNHFNDMVDGYVFVTGGTGAPVDLALQGGVVDADGQVGASGAVRTGETATLRLAVTNHGTAPASGDYALILSATDVAAIVSATATGGTFGVSGPSSGVWFTGPVPPGATVMADIVVRVTSAGALKLLATRVAGEPVDPDATNDLVELALDGVGPSPASGRWVAVGNVDAVAGGEIVTGAGEGERPQVRIYSGAGADLGLRFNAFDASFAGGVRLASCDIDDDGRDEIVVGQGPGGSGVKVFRVAGTTVAEVTSLLPFESTFTGGVFVACADLNGDSRDDVVVGAGPGRAPDVRVFAVSAAGPVAVTTFRAYEPAFAGGVRVATGAWGGGGPVAPFQVLTMPGAGRPAELRLWSVAGASAVSVAAADVVPGYQGGALVKAGDADGDGVLDIAVAPDAGAPSLLRIVSLASLQWIVDAAPGAAGFTGGLRLDLGRLTGGSGRAELLTGGGAGSLPDVRVFQLGPGGGLERVRLRAFEVP